MIRARIEQDLDRLSAVLDAMRIPSSRLRGKDPKEWLQEYDAELSWVFDMAPVPVTPTKNVVGHIQVYRPAAESPFPHLAEYANEPADKLLAIGKHFVRPNTYEYGIGRYLLKESVEYIQSQGKIPTLELNGNGFLPQAFYEKFGFEEVPSDDPGETSMIYTK